MLSPTETSRSFGKSITDLWMWGTGWGSFIAALRQYYIEDDRLPSLVNSTPKISLTHCFVNLALIGQKTHERQEKISLSEKRISEIASYRDELHQSLLNSGKYHGINELFDKAALENRSTPTGWACITGLPGMGKSSLLQFISHRWGLFESLWSERFEFVFRVKLNLVKQADFKSLPLNAGGIDCLAHLIFLSLERKFRLEDIRSCLIKHPERILLLLDGFEEIASLYRRGDSKVTALIDSAMDFPNGILTSRPNPVDLALIPHFKERRFEILGLTEDQVRQYIQRYPFTEAGLTESLLNELSTNLDMLSLAQIPVNLSAICLTYELKTPSHGTGPIFTMTHLYQRVVTWLLRRYVDNQLTSEEKEHGLKASEMSSTEIVTRCSEELQTLTDLAYDGFQKNEVQSLSPQLLEQYFPDQALLLTISEKLGFLRAFGMPEGDKAYTPHYFIHLTYQEYFAALYIAQKLSCPSDELDRENEIQRRKMIQNLARMIQKERNNPRYNVILTFVAGLISTPEYKEGADYFWDAMLDFPVEPYNGIGVHPHFHILKTHYRIYRELFLNAKIHPELGLPAYPELHISERLAKLYKSIQVLLSWESACPIEDIDVVLNKEKVYAQLERTSHKKSQLEMQVFGVEPISKVSLALILTQIPTFRYLLYGDYQSQHYRSCFAQKHIDDIKSLINSGIRDMGLLQTLRQFQECPLEEIRDMAFIALAHTAVQYPELIEFFKTTIIMKEPSYNGFMKIVAFKTLVSFNAQDAESIQIIKSLVEDHYYQRYAVSALRECKGAIDLSLLQKLRNIIKTPSHLRFSQLSQTECFEILVSLHAQDHDSINTIRNLLKESLHIYGKVATIKMLQKCNGIDPELFQLLKRTAKSDNEYHAPWIIEVFSHININYHEQLQIIKAQTKSYRFQIRTAAFEALERLRADDAGSLEIFEKCVLDGNAHESIRVASIKGLGYACKKDSGRILILKRLLKDRSYTIRGEVIRSLARIGIQDIEFVKSLKEEANDINQGTDTRIFALEALERFDKIGLLRSLELTTFLQEIVRRDSNESIREVAINMLSKSNQHYSVWGMEEEELKNHIHDAYRGMSTRMAKKIAVHASSLPVDFDRDVLCAVLGEINKKIHNRYSETQAVYNPYAETSLETIYWLCLALIRVPLHSYLSRPGSRRNGEISLITSVEQYIFVVSIWLHNKSFYWSNHQLFLNGENSSFFVGQEESCNFIEKLKVQQEKFVVATGLSDVMCQLMEPINLPRMTNVFDECFLTENLPEAPLSDIDRDRRLRAVEAAVIILSTRVDRLTVDVNQIREELNRITREIEDKWEKAQPLLAHEKAYIKKFKQQLVQMYIVATVASTGSVQLTLTGTVGNAASVLNVIAGLVPWGGGAVQMFSYLLQAIDTRITQTRMERVTHLGDTPEEVAKIATTLSQRLLHCLELENCVQDGRIMRLFTSLGNIIQSFVQDGFYGALFDAFTESGVVDDITGAIARVMTPSEIEERASNDVKLLLSAIMEKTVPKNTEHETNISRLFLYSAPLLTVVDQLFRKIIERFCIEQSCQLEQLVIPSKSRAIFCNNIAEKCHEYADDVAERIEDTQRRESFVNNLARDFSESVYSNRVKGVFYFKKTQMLNPMMLFARIQGKKYASVNGEVLKPEVAGGIFQQVLSQR